MLSALIVLVAFLIFMYVLLPQFIDMSDQIKTLRSANFVYAAAGLAVAILSYVVASVTYLLISHNRLSFVKTFVVQMATAFTNRLLPIGLGGMGLNVQYLRNEQHSYGEAAALVAVNGILGGVAHSIMLSLLYVFSASALVHLALPKLSLTFLIISTMVLLTALTAIYIFRSRVAKTVTSFVRQLSTYLRKYRKDPQKLLFGTMSAMALTTTYAVVLMLSAAAFDIHISVWQALIVLTVELVVATATPTPGGIGGAEAGLAAGIVALGFNSGQGLAVALLYRFLTFWLPIIPGALFFLSIRKKYLA